MRAAALESLAYFRDRQWSHLRDTFEIEHWREPLGALGADQQNIMSLALLAQQGLPGRAEANRLLWTWMKPTSLESLSYINAPMTYQADWQLKEE